ncbi:MAG: HDOD domain-containing protein [Desulfobacula sp.]|uniref:HDOD domain-containing protein n=1 Tax=Desulfobacula sp. TaxID=2593537 RepID=UPI0025BC122D|nr:HDOD domain-containing protein [Desulfobacula sp.]MCD4721340.1 HDOD domain-containing protein [Desulfobacula sp.]
MKILIVDDENISRTILLKKMELIGECTAVDDSLNALELYDKAVKNKEPFDLITLDVSMPKMDGRQLLQLIRKKEKALKIIKKDRVKIIMVSSRMNMSIIKECIKLGCDGYISKPVNKYQLLENLSRMGFALPTNIEKDDKKKHTQIVARIIKRFYKGKIKLPVLPRIVNEVQQLMESQDPSIEDLAEIVKKDILISSKLISIANSPLYRGVDKADSLNAALLRLGIEASQGLIATLVTKNLFKSDNKILNRLLEKLWMHSFACACIGKRFAEELGIQKSETVFLMGIVHDIGKMLLLKAIADMDPKESFENMEIQVAIHEIHTTFGAAVLKKMRFSNEFIRIAEFHHWNDFSKNDEQELLIIHLSDYLAKEIGFSFFDVEEIDDEAKSDSRKKLENLESLKQLNLDPDKAMEIADEIKAIIQDSAQAF